MLVVVVVNALSSVVLMVTGYLFSCWGLYRSVAVHDRECPVGERFAVSSTFGTTVAECAHCVDMSVLMIMALVYRQD